MNRKPAYFIQFDTFWANSRTRFCGPFASRREAQAEIDAALADEAGEVGLGMNSPRNIQEAIRVWGIVTRSEARQLGLHEDTEPWDAFGVLPRTCSTMRQIEIEA